MIKKKKKVKTKNSKRIRSLKYLKKKGIGPKKILTYKLTNKTQKVLK